MNSSYYAKEILPDKPLTASKSSGIRWSRHIPGYLFLLPALILFAVFAWYPIARSVIMSFQNVTLGSGEATWAGLDNYRLMLKDPAFEIAWKNSLEFLLWSLAFGYIVPLTIAMLVHEMRIGKGFFRIVYFLPTVIPVSIAVIVWRFIFDPDIGVANATLGSIGISSQLWLQDPGLAKPTLVFIMTWAAFGTTMLIYLASLQDISVELYEAAELDGANPTQRVWHIALPHLYPVMSLLFLLQVIAVVQVFTEPFLLTNGGPGRETLTPAMHIYNRAFIRLDTGYASAWSVVMIVVLATFSIIYRVANHRITAGTEQ